MISESDVEPVCISTRELYQLQADVRHLHDENLELTKQNLALSLTIRNGWDQRQQPLKASLEMLSKLNKDTLFKYLASHNMAPCKRSGLRRITHEELMVFLVIQKLVVNCQADGELVRANLVANSQDTRFLFIATPDCKLITMKFEAKFVRPDVIKLEYIQILRALYDQEVPAEWVRLFPNDLFKKDDKKIETLNTKIMNLDKLNVPCLHAMHLVHFQIYVKVLPEWMFSLMVMPNTTFLELKQKIQDKLDEMERPIQPESWYFRVHWSQSWARTADEDHDNDCLAHFNLQSGDVIKLQYRLRGGGLELADVNMEEIIMTEY